MIIKAFGAVCRTAINHLTKILGGVGLAVMAAAESAAQIDPTAVMGAATQFLRDEHWIKKVGMVLFGLVIVRGWWTGIQVKKLKAAAAAPPAPGP